MRAIQILDIKPFMQLLFQTDVLDLYKFVSAELRTDMLYSLDGHINRDFFCSEELDTLHLTGETYLPWHIAREKVFMLIKGKKTPSQLKIILKFSDSQINNFLKSSNSSLNSNDINGLFLNIMFQENKLNVICGISYNVFTMNKDLESELFDLFVTLFKSHNIACE